MPRARRRCGHQDCDQIVPCDTHKPKPWAGSTRHSTRASRRVRTQVLTRDPICRCPGCPRCTSTGCTRASTEDDHLRNVASGGSDDLANHAGKCAPCHRWKTQQEAAAARR